MWLPDLDDTEASRLIEWARTQHLQSIVKCEAAHQAWIEAVHDFVQNKMRRRGIRPYSRVTIDFENERCVCIYEGLRAGRIIFRDFTKKGKPCKIGNSTNWEMWEFIQPYSVEE